ncbi:YkvA family protein [Blastococcus sp. SYSU D01042]
MDLLGTVVAVLGGLVLLWLALLLAVWRSRALAPREALRLLPDLVRLVRRLAADRTLPRGVRVRLWLLLGYLVSPLDLVPDVIPLLGHADDVVLVAWTLRSVVRTAGPDALARHWPGDPRGLALVSRLAGLPAAGPPRG